MTDPFQFALAVAIILATPGPTNTLLLTAGAASGFRALRLIPAEVLGYLTTIMIVGYFVGNLAQTAPGFAVLLRIIVAVYLILLAVRLWRAGLQASAEARLVTFRDVLITTMLNPKALVFAVGIIPVHAADSIAYFHAFGAMVIIAGSGWALLGIGLTRGILPAASKHLVARAGAVVITGFAGYLLITSVLPTTA